MQDPRDDGELVTALVEGDRTALAAIYDRYADALHDTAAAMLGDRHEAADVTQDVFLTAAQKLHQLQDRSRLRPWLFAVLRHEVYRRTGKRRRTVATDFSQPGVVEMTAAPDPLAEATEVEAAELGAALRMAALGLDPRDQLVLELSARQGLAGADLASALGVSVDQGYVLVHRMRERVERSLGALTVARMGRRDCPELQQVLAGWDGTFSVLVRKRVARHIERCDVCEATKRRHAVLPLLSAAPAMAAPAGLRELVLDRVTSGATTGSDVRFDAAGGFPSTPRRSGRILVRVAAGSLAVVVGLLAWWLATRNDGPTISEAAPAPSVAPTVPAATTATPTTTSTTTTSTTSSTSSTTTSSAPSTTSVAPTTAPPSSTIATPTTAPLVPPPATTAPGTPAPPTTPPPTTASPATTSTTAPPPGRVELSVTTLDLGASAPAGIVTLTNTGNQPVQWSIVGSTGNPPLTVAPAAGALQPGQSTPVSIGIDRSNLPEGDIVRQLQVSSTALGGGTITVLARVERPPVVQIFPGSVVSCGQATSSVSATVSDESPLSGVVLSWAGAGSPGSTPMSFVNGAWLANFGGTAPGWWVLTVTATDVRGNAGTAQAEVLAVGC